MIGGGRDIGKCFDPVALFQTFGRRFPGIVVGWCQGEVPARTGRLEREIRQILLDAFQARAQKQKHPRMKKVLD